MERTLLKLTREDIRLLHANVQCGRVKPGQVLVGEGRPPPGLFVVRSGSVLLQRDINRYIVTTAILGPGDMFGETAFISPTPQPATGRIVAADDTEIAIFTPQRVTPLFDKHPGLFSRFFQSIALAMSRRLRAYNEQAGGAQRDRFGTFPAWEIL